MAMSLVASTLDRLQERRSGGSLGGCVIILINSSPYSFILSNCAHGSTQEGALGSVKVMFGSEL